MSFDEDQFYADLRRRIKEEQDRLKKSPDDELMRVHEEILDTPEHRRNPALAAAVLNEVQRRFVAAGWFWRRWFKRDEYDKWVNHNRITEVKASQAAIAILSKADDPASQEAVQRLKEYIRGISDKELPGD